MRYVYLLQCADSTLYTGITTDLERRVDEHNGSGASKGAKYTKPRRPVELVRHKECKNRSLATKLELEIKAMSRDEKMKLV